MTGTSLCSSFFFCCFFFFFFFGVIWRSTNQLKGAAPPPAGLGCEAIDIYLYFMLVAVNLFIVIVYFTRPFSKKKYNIHYCVILAQPLRYDLPTTPLFPPRFRQSARMHPRLSAARLAVSLASSTRCLLIEPGGVSAGTRVEDLRSLGSASPILNSPWTTGDLYLQWRTKKVRRKPLLWSVFIWHIFANVSYLASLAGS